MFTNDFNMSLPPWAQVKKIVDGMKTYWLSGKEKTPGTAVSKEGHADSVLGHESTHHNWFPWKRRNWK